MNHASLFSGIGGFDLAAEWMGWQNVLHCEINPFCQRVLKYYWPSAISYADIKQTDFTIHRGTIDVLTGGFPCQPFSTAGKRKGTEDDRHLWPEMLRAIREIQPRWVVGENVRGLINWSGGLVFEQVQIDLEAEGYKVLPFILPACGVNAPHRRDRIWFVAYAESNGSDRTPNSTGQTIKGSNRQQAAQLSKRGQVWSTPNATGKRQQGHRRTKHTGNTAAFENWKASWSHDDDRWPTVSPVFSGDDGLPNGLDGTTLSDHNKESLKAAGNAIVPQVAYQIFKAIEQYDLHLCNS